MFKKQVDDRHVLKKHNTKSNCHEVCAYSVVVKPTHIAKNAL